MSLTQLAVSHSVVPEITSRCLTPHLVHAQVELIRDRVLPGQGWGDTASVHTMSKLQLPAQLPAVYFPCLSLDLSRNTTPTHVEAPFPPLACHLPRSDAIADADTSVAHATIPTPTPPGPARNSLALCSLILIATSQRTGHLIHAEASPSLTRATQGESLVTRHTRGRPFLSIQLDRGAQPATSLTLGFLPIPSPSGGGEFLLPLFPAPAPAPAAAPSEPGPSPPLEGPG